MGRTAFASQNALLYLENFAKQQRCVIGLILGQICSTQDDINIVHFAKTPEEKFEPVGDEFGGKPEELNLKTVSESWVADHAKHVTRMLPGGMFVLGIFVVSPDDIFTASPVASKLKSILTLINKTVSANKYMNGSPVDCSERLIIHMSHSQKVTAKSIEVAQAGFFKPIEINFNSKSNWLQLECYYEFDELYPVVLKNNTGISVKDQFQEILEAAHKSIESSVVILDGKLRDSTDKLESQFTKPKSKSGAKSGRDEEVQTVQVSILVPCESKIPDSVEYMECEGTTHFSGIVASRIFLNSKATIEQAITAVKQDIIRSLAARFTMHCDALIDDSLLPEEKVCFNEPPRRVYIRLPESGDGKVFLCDYLFPGESPVEALVSVKEMLDANITEEDVICNVETPADTSEFDALEKDPSSEEMLTTPQDGKQMFLSMGVGVAVIILLIAVISYYYVTVPFTLSS